MASRTIPFTEEMPPIVADDDIKTEAVERIITSESIIVNEDIKTEDVEETVPAALMTTDAGKICPGP